MMIKRNDKGEVRKRMRDEEKRKKRRKIGE